VSLLGEQENRRPRQGKTASWQASQGPTWPASLVSILTVVMIISGRTHRDSPA